MEKFTLTNKQIETIINNINVDNWEERSNFTEEDIEIAAGIHVYVEGEIEIDFEQTEVTSFNGQSLYETEPCYAWVEINEISVYTEDGDIEMTNKNEVVKEIEEAIYYNIMNCNY